MWNLYKNNIFLEPLKYSNGKTQEDIVKEVIDSIKQGFKIIFIKGVCGTGKSAIALNLARKIGKTSIVVPIKSLQEQYEADYTKDIYLIKNSKKLKISIITGRNNHTCPFNNCRADNPKLPCTIEIKEENINELKDYIKQNDFVDKKDFENIKDIRRFSIAPSCDYWSPILPEEFKVNMFKNCKFKKYKAINGINYNIYKRRQGCSYYDQFDSYVDADVIIFNSKKYELENVMDRKPATELEIIDECDKFLDDLSNQKTLDLNYLSLSLGNLKTVDRTLNLLIRDINDLINGIIKEDYEDKIYLIENTKVLKLLEYFLNNPELENLFGGEDYSYVSRGFETAKAFKNFFDETYLYFHKNKRDHLCVTLVTINLEKRFKELLDKNKVFIMMSGTIHSEEVLKNIFGIDEFKIIEAETENYGKITEVKTGLEKDFRYRNFISKRVTRKDYLDALSKCVEKAKKPTLVQINSFKDLPNKDECEKYNIKNLKIREELIEDQKRYRKGELVRKFKNKELDILFSTQGIRGVDFPGEICNSIIFTKYPYPNVSDLFWKVLRKTNPNAYWLFYGDKARREFLQRTYRGLRFKEDHIYLLSPDIRIFNNQKV